jgi:hypothetical protein
LPFKCNLQRYIAVPAAAYVTRNMKHALGFPGWLRWHLALNVGAFCVAVVGVASSAAGLCTLNAVDP